MTFTYENQGAATFLVCELAESEALDALTLGMLTNNHISGLAPVLYTEMDGRRFLKYTVSAKVPASRFFTGTVARDRLLTAFQNMTNALCGADEYMIEQSCFEFDAERVFLNVSSCECALICVPIVQEKDSKTAAAALFRQILFTTNLDPQEDTTYLTRLLTCLNDPASFSLYAFRSLLQELRTAPAVQPQAYGMGGGTPAALSASQVNQNTFDKTLSVHDVSPALLETPPASQQNTGWNGVPIQQYQYAPQYPKPQITSQQNYAAQPQTSYQPPVQPQPAKETAPKQENRGFAIPGQPVQPQPQNNSTAAAPQEKPMSFMHLMMHYSKENAELYKAQKAEKKAAAPEKKRKEKKKKEQPVPQPVYPPAPQQQYNYIPPAPVPVHNSFMDTLDLSTFQQTGATTVLNANQPIGPRLIRSKTGEQVSINKPVFRVGKERSYVDYFIGDNSAISRSHCNIYSEAGQYFIEDTNSTNHTYVNGAIVNSGTKVPISNGDGIRLANEDFVFLC